MTHRTVKWHDVDTMTGSNMSTTSGTRISGALDLLEIELKENEAALRCLEERLSPALGVELEAKAVNSEANQVKQFSLMANRIEAATSHVRRQRDAISAILNRLEI